MSNNLTTYQHYKGGIYIKLCEAIHSESKETLVIYVCSVGGQIYARPKSMFYEQVKKDNYKGPRFIVIPPVVANKAKIEIINNQKD